MTELTASERPPAPHKGNIREKGSRLESRSAGFALLKSSNSPLFPYRREPNSFALGEYLDSRNFREVRSYLEGGPTEADSKQVRRRHFLDIFFHPHSERVSSKQVRKMLKMRPVCQPPPEIPVTAQRTLGGRKYGQIVTKQVYDPTNDASTYQVNETRQPAMARENKELRRQFASAKDLGQGIETFVQTPSHFSEHKKPTLNSAGPPATAHHGLRTGGLVNDAGAETSMKWKRTTDENVENTRAILPLHDIEEFSSSGIPYLGDSTGPTPSSSRSPLAKTESEIRVIDYATNGSTRSAIARAMRGRSRSPAKKAEKQIPAATTPLDKSNLSEIRSPAAELRPPNPDASNLLPAVPKPPVRASPPSAQSPTAHKIQNATKISSGVDNPAKPPSLISAESTPEDQSDASSGVVANAQVAEIVRAQGSPAHYSNAPRIPPQSGPAPTTPLPSVPEGYDRTAPATPRPSESSQRVSSPDRSPTKIPPKSPARYRWMPVSTSPTRRPPSPRRIYAATAREQVNSQPSSLVQQPELQDILTPRPELSPVIMNLGTVNQRQRQQMIEATNIRKTRHLERVQSQRATIEEARPTTPNRYEKHGERIALITTRDSFNPSLSPSKHRPQTSQASEPSEAITFQPLNSRTLSQRLSPIMVIAEQKPISQVQWMPSQNSQISNNSIDERPYNPKTNGTHITTPFLAPPSLSPPDELSSHRPNSSHSLPPPQPVASRVPTPFFPSIPAVSQHSSHRFSLHETDFEARLSAIERKSFLLERAFLAVLDTSAPLDGSMHGTLSGNGRDRSSGVSAAESLYAGLESLLAAHAGGMGAPGARVSTSSGP
ncbi:Proteoglycan-4 [Mycoblastus sanguinarius]|nr:Proteoglycan-4 [Mycoblastus sanguinarius]